jgi:hypothetical protein
MNLRLAVPIAALALTAAGRPTAGRARIYIASPAPGAQLSAYTRAPSMKAAHRIQAKCCTSISSAPTARSGHVDEISFAAGAELLLPGSTPAD